MIINSLHNCTFNAARPSKTGTNALGEPTYSQAKVYLYNIPARLIVLKGSTQFEVEGDRIITDGYFMVDYNTEYGSILAGDIITSTFDTITRRVLYVNPITGVSNTVHHYEIYFVNIP